MSEENSLEILESEWMESEVIYWNVMLSYLVYVPFVKGTSDEKERVRELERVMEVVSENEQSPVVNVVN